MKIKKIYLAGPITGVEGYREAFRKWEEHYRGRGYTVLNPAVLPEGLSPDEVRAMLEDKNG